jgi:uncharacterized protein (TIGR03435 family)
MLQTLLEDRFELRTHREAKQVAVFVLGVAKGGLNRPGFAGGWLI